MILDHQAVVKLHFIIIGIVKVGYNSNIVEIIPWCMCNAWNIAPFVFRGEYCIDFHELQYKTERVCVSCFTYTSTYFALNHVYMVFQALTITDTMH